MNYRAEPQSLFNSAFSLIRDGSTVGVVQLRLFGRKASVEIDDVDYLVVRTGVGSWQLEQQGVPGSVASAERLGVMRTRYRLGWDGGTLDVAQTGLGHRMTLMRGEDPVGSVRAANLFSRTLLIEVPDDMPTQVVGLLAWLVIRLRRAAAAAAGGGA